MHCDSFHFEYHPSDDTTVVFLVRAVEFVEEVLEEAAEECKECVAEIDLEVEYAPDLPKRPPLAWRERPMQMPSSYG